MHPVCTEEGASVQQSQDRKERQDQPQKEEEKQIIASCLYHSAGVKFFSSLEVFFSAHCCVKSPWLLLLWIVFSLEAPLCVVMLLKHCQIPPLAWFSNDNIQRQNMLRPDYRLAEKLFPVCFFCQWNFPIEHYPVLPRTSQSMRSIGEKGDQSGVNHLSPQQQQWNVEVPT